MVLKIRDANGNIQEVLALKGEKGDSYVLTEADKQEIATKVAANLSTENWTFTLENGSTVTKTVVLK
jgi:hypothetical protein